jgi:hypothetical protein
VRLARTVNIFRDLVSQLGLASVKRLGCTPGLHLAGPMGILG